MDIETAREEDAENSGECDEAIIEKGMGPDLTLLRQGFNPDPLKSFYQIFCTGRRLMTSFFQNLVHQIYLVKSRI